MKERSGINNLVGIDYSFLASFIVFPVSTYIKNYYKLYIIYLIAGLFINYFP
jgi:hypothetical protein